MISVQSSLLILSLSLSVLSANVSITNDDGNIIVTANRMNISGSLYVNGSLALTEATLHALVDLETKVAELETRLFLAASSASYISTWDTTRTATGSSSNVQVRLPLQSNGTYNFTASWGDGSQSHITTSEDAAVVHTYSQEGNYTLALHGTIEGWRFNNGGDRLKLLSVTQWGSLKLGNDGAYFYGAENMQILATDPLDLSGTDNLERAFHRTNIGTMGNLNNWDTSKVKKMSHMFRDVPLFNQPLSSWDTSKVTDMSFMFLGASAFNHPLNTWNTDSLLDISFMFRSAVSFNQPLNAWNTSNVIDMQSMFEMASSFNQDLSSWCVSNFASLPSSFDLEASQWSLSRPLWGSCP